MLNVRRAGVEDLEDVIRLRLAFLEETKAEGGELNPQVVESTRHYIAEKLPAGEFLAWFAEKDGRIVGTGGLVFFHRPPTAGCLSDLHAYVLNMYTLPDRRGQGIASTILNHIIEYVRTTSALRVSLHASEMGRSVYERLGFKESTSEMVLKLEGNDR